LLGAAAAGIPLGGWLAYRGRQSPFTGRSVEVPRPALAIPGPFPGRVVEVQHQGAVNARYDINADTVAAMMRRGMCQLVGTSDVDSAWQRFFERDDVVGIKVNPVGQNANRRGRQGRPGVVSSPAIVLETVRCLHEYAGIPRRNIIVFDRYADAFRQVYDKLMRSGPMKGVKWYASSSIYNDTQLAIDGQELRDRDRHVVGYDPDVFVSMGYCAREHDQHDDRRHRSHLSMIVSRLVNKIITIPNLKDHKSGGVTIALKNLSHGMNNNVARSHLGNIPLKGGEMSFPNQCGTFIPTAVAQRPTLEKATLHILDGLIGVYEGGPGMWNATWGYWPRQSLFFATDPVAMDHVGWDIIDAKRVEMGWLPVAQMGRLHGAPGAVLSPRLAALAAMTPPFGTAGALLETQCRQAQLRSTVEFDRRQPEHIVLAGVLGLGRFNANEIDHRVIRMSPQSPP
jgi:hypothetical protein